MAPGSSDVPLYDERCAFVIEAATFMRGRQELLPVDLNEVARLLDVLEIRHPNIIEDGRVVSEGDDVVIELGWGRTLRRQRFTLAHELAHVMLWRQEAAQVPLCHVPGTADEERLCDQIAGELLVPLAFVSRYFECRSVNLDRLRDVAKHTRSSLSTVAIAVAEGTGRLAMLVTLHRGATSWLPEIVVGCPSGMFGSVRLAKATQAQLDRDPGSPGVRRAVDLVIGERAMTCEADVSRSGDRAVMLVTGVDL